MIIQPSARALTTYKHEPYVSARFRLADGVRAEIARKKPRFGFGGFGEATYYRTYSRIMEGGKQEQWADTVLRVIDGAFSIRKDWYHKHGLGWDEGRWQHEAALSALSMFDMHWLPPGRGLFAMGTNYVYERGSMALFNCAYTDVGVDTLAADLGWLMDALMCGCGVGFEAVQKPYEMSMPSGTRSYYVVPDTREGWVESVELLLQSYLQGSNPVDFHYDDLRPYGAALKGLGGVSAGAEPLKKLHAHIRMTCDRYVGGEFGGTRLVADLANGIAKCVVMGNIRRSAQIAIGSIHDQEFLDLKNYEKHPEREEWGYLSNNSARLEKSEDFEKIPEIAARVKRNGEPGFINQIAVQKFARFGREVPDRATGMNPCSEIPLEPKELCNLAEVFPTRCQSDADIVAAMERATVYTSTVTLLPTHRPETNRVIARNRRIGVSVSGVADWLDSGQTSAAKMTKLLRLGYKKVRGVNESLAIEAGIPTSIRVTTVKPSGTISLLTGVSPGLHYPTFKYAIRRIRVARDSAILKTLVEAGYPAEVDSYEPDNTYVVEFPIDQGLARKATEVSVWEQAAQLATFQREWSDNSVSVTLYFDPKTEADQLEHVFAQIAPTVKSVSALPHTPEGVYAQAPYSEISKEEYERRKAAVKPIDWSLFRGDGQDEKYCDAGVCKVERKVSA